MDPTESRPTGTTSIWGRSMAHDKKTRLRKAAALLEQSGDVLKIGDLKVDQFSLLGGAITAVTAAAKRAERKPPPKRKR